MQWYELLTHEQVEQVHETSLRILEQIGIDFTYPPALEVFSKGGAKVDGKRVIFPPRLVEQQLKKAPSQFRLYARNPEKDVVIGGDHMVFTPGYGAPFVTDLDHGRRTGTSKDFENFVKLTGASTNQDICSGVVIEPNDVPHEIRHVQMLYNAIKYTDKCFMGSTMGEKGARDSIRMASILFGSEAQLAEKPRLISILCSLSPLKYDDRMLGALAVHLGTLFPSITLILIFVDHNYDLAAASLSMLSCLPSIPVSMRKFSKAVCNSGSNIGRL